MKRLISSLITAFVLTVNAAGADGHAHLQLDNESLPYKVMFKWGLINKQAGRAVLNLNHGAGEYHSELTARSEPWADHFYSVRDTLRSTMRPHDFLPKFYEKIANEDGDRKHDRVLFHYADGQGVKADSYRKEYKKGTLKIDDHHKFESDSIAVDMLSSFYVMRTLPYEKWTVGQTYSVPIFSGKQTETLTIKYHGEENLKIDNQSYPVYHITFIFTSRGGTKSSDDMDAWIYNHKSRIPLRLEGKLPVGKVHCIYTGEL